MNNDLAAWSLPWHELQRSLAAGFGAHAGAHAAGGSPCPRGPSDARCVPAPASWLVRARTCVLPASLTVK
ncbi:MAG TPA: hypothetical protein VKP66_13990 [Steroidobacteraceae bacterium]|nr:hypothetical protein [Steroidobacteraceae bacterium]